MSDTRGQMVLGRGRGTELVLLICGAGLISGTLASEQISWYLSAPFICLVLYILLETDCKIAT